MTSPSKPVFWRDSRMPYVELREVGDGRQVCYAPHSHTQWSLGAITGGTSTFRYRDDVYGVGAGDLVLVNPEWVHACNPIDNQPWAYLMIYVDTAWLTPHAYLVNRRVQLGQQSLKKGKPIVDAALNAGFADQPHFQRTFKRLMAATPNQYRMSSIDQQVDAAHCKH